MHNQKRMPYQYSISNSICGSLILIINHVVYGLCIQQVNMYSLYVKYVENRQEYEIEIVK